MPKLFVLDTSVLLFDHNAINNFEDNNIVIPITVLEELDNFKIGNETRNFEARAVIRFLDKLSETTSLSNWISLGPKKGKLKIGMETFTEDTDDAINVYGTIKNDHKILNVAINMKKEKPRTKVILVTKDINLRIKAKALGILAEDYLTGKVDHKGQEDIEKDKGSISCEGKLITALYKKKVIPAKNILGQQKVGNEYYILKDDKQSVLARYEGMNDTIELVEKQFAFGIKPKNAEQTFAMNALLNDEIPLVALQGVAGTGKTLLAIAAAFEQKNLYDQIILSRPIIPLSNREIGFLPGGEEDKIAPYMQPLWDNIKFIKSQFKENARKAHFIDDLTTSGELTVAALNFIRGRSLTHTMFIIDEAQNLTPHEVKTIITRAGEGTKIVFTGDVHQIDTPYLDEYSNGLSYIINRLKGSDLFAHIKLVNGERSELANLANELL